ncbi:MAG TPA: hypothetical protein VGB85_32555 [Nannocystis sp.]|jgi:cysteine-rich repeat protein
MNDDKQNMHQRDPHGPRRTPQRLVQAAMSALCAGSLAACFNPTADGETTGTTHDPAESTSGSSSSGTPTTSGADSSTSVDLTTSTTSTTGTSEPLTGSTSDATGTTGPALDESYCGDGVLDRELNEVCDDGDFLNNNECTNFCTLPTCGDKFLGPDEACDDGNQEPGDGCDIKCQCERTTCGNGMLERGEVCDDGNISDRDACSACCERLYYYAFVTSQMVVGGEIDSIQDADMRCTQLANAAGLQGPYRAWLAGDRGPAAPAADVFARPYALPGTAEIVAHSLNELRSGQLAAAIHVTEKGEDIGAVPADPCLDAALRVWTGTDSSGTGVWNATCSNWSTLDLPDLVGRFGAAGTSGPTWASCEMEVDCDMMARLYCFEVQT